MKIAAVQHDIVWHDPIATQQRLTPMIEQAAAAGARLIALTEMYSTGFSMAIDRITEEPGGPSEQFLLDTAKRHDTWLAASVPQRWQGGQRPRNTGLLIAPDGTVHRYGKLHPFSFAGEDKHFDSGDTTLTVSVDDLSVSLFICYDLRFANYFWPLAPQTDCYLVVANWPEARREHWQTLLTARAIENQAYVVGVNRVGADRSGQRYLGDSRIIDPAGHVLAEATDTETVLIADVDPEFVQRTRREFPVLSDRREFPTDNSH